MKNWRKYFAICLVLALVMTGGCGNAMTTAGEHLCDISELLANQSERTGSGSEAMLSDEDVTFYMSRSSAGFYVEKNGIRFSSCPEEYQSDPVASPAVQSQMRSEFVLYYYNEKQQLLSMNSFSDSVQKNQYRIEQEEDCVRVYYTLGSFTRGIEAIPKKLSEARMNEAFLENPALSSSQQKWIKKRYRLEDGWYIWKESESDLVVREMLSHMDEAGYTDEDLARDNESAGISLEEQSRIGFQVVMEYRLEDGELKVRIPMDQFRYTGSVEPVKLDVLRYFGAEQDDPDGYIFVPDGSGGILYLEEAASNNDYYEAEVYGGDGNTSAVRLPVFGITNGEKGVFTRIEKGSAIASVAAYPSGHFSSYSMVYASFLLEAHQYTTLGDGEYEAEVLSFQRRMYNDDIALAYAFLFGEEATYSGMATYYRNVLLREGTIRRLAKDAELSLTLQTIGSIHKTKNLAIIRYRGRQVLTSFSDEEELIGRFRDAGVQNLSVEMMAWCNDGFEQTIATRVKVLSALGGRQGLKQLLADIADSGVSVSGTIKLLSFSTSSSFKLYRYGARTVDQSFAMDRKKDIVTGEEDTSGRTYHAAPSNLQDMTAGIVKSMKQIPNLTLTIEDVGVSFTGDYRKRNGMNREEALDAIRESLKTLSESVRLSFRGGNDYVIPYTDTISSAPVDTSLRSAIDEAVPFYAMVFHGYLNMSSEPINYKEDSEKLILKSIESGFGISACTMVGESSEVKDTEYASYYSAGVNDCFDRIMGAWEDVSAAVGDLASVGIREHMILSDKVHCTVYENGTKIYVNYNYEEYADGHIRIPARGWLRKD